MIYSVPTLHIKWNRDPSNLCHGNIMTLEKYVLQSQMISPYFSVDWIITIDATREPNWAWQLYMRCFIFWRAYLYALPYIQCAVNNSKRSMFCSNRKRPHLEPIDSCNSSSIFKIFKTCHTHSVTWNGHFKIRNRCHWIITLLEYVKCCTAMIKLSIYLWSFYSF